MASLFSPVCLFVFHELPGIVFALEFGQTCWFRICFWVEWRPPQGEQRVWEGMAMRTDGTEDPSLRGEEVYFDLVGEVWTWLEDVVAPSESFCAKRWAREP